MRVHPVYGAAHRLSSTEHLLHRPENSLAIDRGAITRAAAMTSSMEMLPLCWMFFTFLRSLGGSFKALMTRAAAEGTTEQVACLFWIFSCTVTLRPFQSAVALAISSPIFLGDKPSGPTLGAKAEVAATSPPTAFSTTTLISLGSNLGGILNRCFSFYKLWRKKTR